VLAISEEAAQAVQSLVTAPGMPEGAGLRITTEVTEVEGGPRQDLRLRVVSEPSEGDEVLEAERIFVDPQAAEFLDDKILDADIVDDDVRWSLDIQAETR
jgi:iron-sulfur cluster assembly protein